MTKETLQERMTTLSRYFARDKWKAESGFFQYPRGKKRTEAVAEALEIAFDPSEFAIKKELNLRGEDVVGSVFLVAVPTEGIFGGYSYLSLTITDHVFIVTQLPEKSVAALALLENSGEKLADSVETYEPEHEEDLKPSEPLFLWKSLPLCGSKSFLFETSGMGTKRWCSLAVAKRVRKCGDLVSAF